MGQNFPDFPQSRSWILTQNKKFMGAILQACPSIAYRPDSHEQENAISPPRNYLSDESCIFIVKRLEVPALMTYLPEMPVLIQQGGQMFPKDLQI